MASKHQRGVPGLIQINAKGTYCLHLCYEFLLFKSSVPDQWNQETNTNHTQQNKRTRVYSATTLKPWMHMKNHATHTRWNCSTQCLSLGIFVTCYKCCYLCFSFTCYKYCYSRWQSLLLQLLWFLTFTIMIIISVCEMGNKMFFSNDYKTSKLDSC